LPDGLFSDQKSQFWFIFVGLGMYILGIFYGQFGTLKFFPTLVCYNKKIWQPWERRHRRLVCRPQTSAKGGRQQLRQATNVGEGRQAATPAGHEPNTGREHFKSSSFVATEATAFKSGRDFKVYIEEIGTV
jgi:hypothetical protein